MKVISCIQSAGMYCNEIAMATAANYYQRNYECMFIDSWNFSFSGVNEGGVFADRFGADSTMIEKKLLQYHGIACYHKEFSDAEECLDFLKKCLFNNNLVAMRFDQACMPWALDKRKTNEQRYAGYVLFFDYCPDKGIFRCIDIHGDRQINELPEQNAYESFLYENRLFKTAHVFEARDEVSSISSDKLLAYIIDNFGEGGRANNLLFKNLEYFIYCIKQSFDFAKEIAYTQKMNINISAPSKIPFVDSVIEIARTRNLFSLSIDYINKGINSAELYDISQRFKILYSEWRAIVSVLTKRFYKSDYLNLKDSIVNMLINIYKEERQLAHELKLVKNCNGVNIFGIKENFVKEIVPIKINKFFNNKAIDFSGMKADFDGLGNYFIYNDKLKRLNGISYGNQYDNIACDAQEIAINNIVCCGMRISGCSDSGSIYGDYVLYDGESREIRIAIGVSDWRFNRCEYGEKCIWEAQRYNFGEIKNDVRGYLFQQDILFVKDICLSKIKLPKNDCLHIFCLELVTVKNNY